MRSSDVLSTFALLTSIAALLISIRQQRGPDIKFLSPNPPQFRISRDRDKNLYGSHVRAEIVIDAIVANEGASSGTLMGYKVELKESPKPVSGVGWVSWCEHRNLNRSFVCAHLTTPHTQ